MKLYLDLIFMLNFLFDLLLLLLVGIILKRNSKLSRLLLGALVGSTSLFILFININARQLFIYKILISVLMVIITFGYKDLKYTGRNLFYLYLNSIVLGGFLYLLNIQFSYKQTGLIFYHHGLSINWLFLLVFSPLILYIYYKQLLTLKNNLANYYLVDIYFKDGSKKKLSAFLDTGNQLIDPYLRRPIILVNKKEINKSKLLEDYLLVPYDTLNSQGLLKCIIPAKVNIWGIGERKHVLIGVVEQKIKMDGIDCILHTKLLEG